MGVAISKIWGTHVQYTGDTTTGLSAKEKATLAESFEYLKQDMPKTGERLFILYFEINPESQNYFKDFRGKTIDELKGNPKLIAHATNVMSAISGIVSLLNEPSSLVENIKRIGYRHGKRNIKPQAITDLKQAFGKLVDEKLPKKYSEQDKALWVKTLELILNVFNDGMKEGAEDKDFN